MTYLRSPGTALESKGLGCTLAEPDDIAVGLLNRHIRPGFPELLEGSHTGLVVRIGSCYRG